MVYGIFSIKFIEHVEYKGDIIHHIEDILSFHLMEFLFTLSLRWEVRHKFRFNKCHQIHAGYYSRVTIIIIF